MLAHLLQVVHQLGVAGVEADPQAGQVRALRQRVHRDHAVEPVLEDRARRPVPGELDVALVAEDRDAVAPAPRRGRAEVVERAGRVARAVDPEAQGARRVGRVDGVEVEPPVGVDRHRHGPAAGERSRPSRRSGRRPPGRARCRGRACAAAATAAACRRAPSCRRTPRSGRSARRRRSAGRASAAAAVAARACRCTAGSPARCRTTTSAATTAAGGGSHGVPIEQVDDAAGQRVGQRGRARRGGRTGTAAGRSRASAHRRRPRLGRRRPRAAAIPPASASGRRDRRRRTRRAGRPTASSRRARTRMPSSSCASTSTSPSRWTAASTSPRS